MINNILFTHKFFQSKYLSDRLITSAQKCGSIDTLLKKIRRAGTIDRQPGSGRPRSVCVNENNENVEDLVFSQEYNPKTHRLNREISCETDIHLLTVHKIIYRDL